MIDCTQIDCNLLASTITAIATAVLALIALVGTIVGLFQLSGFRRLRQLEALRDIWKEFSSENRDLRRKVFETLPSKSPAEADSDDWEDIEKVATSLERVAFLASKRLVKKKYLFELWGRTLIRSWHVLKPFIEYHRSTRRYPSERWKNFEKLAQKAEKKENRKFPGWDASVVPPTKILTGKS